MTVLFSLMMACATRSPAVTVPETQVTRVHPAGVGNVTELVRGRNAVVSRLVLAPGARIPPNVDPTEEYVVVLDGTGTTTVDGVTHDLYPGVALYIPPGVEAGAICGDAPLTVLQVFAGPKPADKYQAWPVQP